MIRTPSSWTFPIALIALVATTAPASAQNKAAAEQLFEEGRQLMKAKQIDAACEKFAASQRVDAALGTLLNLANCRQEQGRLATAWSLFVEAGEGARRAKQDKREKFARDRAAALEPRLPRLRIRTPKTPGTVVTMNGRTVDPGVLDVAVPVDPGPIEIRANAPDHAEHRAKVIALESRTVEIAIPELAVVEKEAPEEPTKPDPKVTDPVAAKPRDTGSPGKGRRILGLSVGAAGVVAAGVGLGFGYRARSRWNGAFDSGDCDRDTDVCNDDGYNETEGARSDARMSTILVGVGLTAAVTGTVLYLTAPTKREDVQVSASVGTNHGLVWFRGRF